MQMSLALSPILKVNKLKNLMRIFFKLFIVKMINLCTGRQ